MIWTNEHDEIIKHGYAVGARLLALAEELGVTKNAVIGRAFRLGLSATGRNYAAILRGSECTKAILDESSVRQARKERQETKTSIAKLAAKYGVAYETMYAVLSRKTWKHVE